MNAEAPFSTPSSNIPPATDAAPAPTTSPDSFDSFGLDNRIQRALVDLGFTRATPIQARSLAPLIAGRDVIGRARTGTGKTAAFGLPLLQRLAPPEGGGRAPSGGVKALVLAPTRELALQVSEAIQSFGKYLNLQTATLYGGASYVPQLRALRDGAQIVVGTPGRLIDHLERGTLDLSGVQMVVLDEADEMLRMGFIEDVERLVGATPTTRQVALFSATMPDAIRRVADKYLKDPVLVQDASGPTSVQAIDQQWIYVPQRFKGEALLRLLRGEPRGTTLVFARTRAGAGEAADALGRAGFQVEALHGDMSQSARERVLDLFRARRLDVVVATDVAARGIDIDHITHVINFDLPENGEVYTHRIGRTGRAGRTGVAITLVTPSQIRLWRGMLAHIRSNAREIQLPTDAAIASRQREALMEDIAKVAGSARVRVATAWGRQMMADKGWSEADLASLALTLLADERGANLEENPSDEPETWGQPALVRKPEARRDVRSDRREGPGRGFQDDRPQRGPHDERHARGFERRDDRRGGDAGPGRGYDRHQDQGPAARPARPARASDRDAAMSPERAARLALFQNEPANAAFDSVPRTPETFAAEKKRAKPAEAPRDRFDRNDGPGTGQFERPARKERTRADDERPVAAMRDERAERPAKAAPRQEGAERPMRSKSDDMPAKAPKSARAEAPPMPERFERPEKPSKPERAEKPAKAERADKPMKAERAEKPAKPERPERAEKPVKAERTTVRDETFVPEQKAATKPRRKGSDEVEISFPAGAQQGVTSGDIFGAFTNEAGLGRDDIGRISIHERVSVVRLPRPIAAAICQRFPALHLRGKKVPLIGPPPGTLMPAAGMAPPKRVVRDVEPSRKKSKKD